MDYTMEDTQNAAPDALEASKLSSLGQRNDTQSVTKRLQTELMQLMMSPSPGISAFPNADGNLLNWTATISGPADTPYDGLKFKLSFAFPSNYPYSPPTVLFKTPIYHPNVDFSGRICLDILKDKWSAVYNVQSVLLSLQSLLGEPNNASPLNAQAAELWDADKEEYKRHVLARHRDIEDIE
ncbi:putative ubiquitin conjugating enzyme (UbcK) [Aspergillus clavatus NRRL 1]|uniref:Ubiquitin-conjugating enzyme E2 2 n=1 Tax=Aspergillus clavatus (strain ATCC 1007 / CBS 513.65 / DSM 816 / NCTC 3887 / NRRL 1 / QM 1276 / 107) TaxID=344612 RepID=A1CUF6_ASPCL|nr:ubiquitin conjugating enzyme (UbcK), putative [Aspergillus clavatus NRRL 1]EAW06943.1 ubiquitin conjugating enzyme (UbcK), putative [Aspergillus clavatus NRRL 1]